MCDVTVGGLPRYRAFPLLLSRASRLSETRMVALPLLDNPTDATRLARFSARYSPELLSWTVCRSTVPTTVQVPDDDSVTSSVRAASRSTVMDPDELMTMRSESASIEAARMFPLLLAESPAIFFMVSR